MYIFVTYRADLLAIVLPPDLSDFRFEARLPRFRLTVAISAPPIGTHILPGLYKNRWNFRNRTYWGLVTNSQNIALVWKMSSPFCPSIKELLRNECEIACNDLVIVHFNTWQWTKARKGAISLSHRDYSLGQIFHFSFQYTNKLLGTMKYKL